MSGGFLVKTTNNGMPRNSCNKNRILNYEGKSIIMTLSEYSLLRNITVALEQAAQEYPGQTIDNVIAQLKVRTKEWYEWHDKHR